MNEPQSYRRFPAITCWIKNLLEGRYSSENKSIFTIFGIVKRVRILATIIDKREIINSQNIDPDAFLDEEDNFNLRLEFDLDDSTGLIRAILWKVAPEQYSNFLKGDIVDVIGIVRQWKNFVSISPEIIKKVEDPNFILLRNAEIIKKIKLGEIQEIPKIPEEEFNIDEISGEVDINDLFKEEKTLESDSIKEKVFSIIEKHTLEGNGISFNKLKKEAHISENDLRNYIRDLEMESKIYQSEENIYQTY